MYNNKKKTKIVTKNTVKTLQQPLIGLFELYLVKYALTFDCKSKFIKYLYLNHSRFLPRFVLFYVQYIRIFNGDYQIIKRKIFLGIGIKKKK